MREKTQENYTRRSLAFLMGTRPVLDRLNAVAFLSFKKTYLETFAAVLVVWRVHNPDGKMRGRRKISSNSVNSLRVVEGYFRKSMVGMYSK